MSLCIDDLFRAGKRDDTGRLKSVIVVGAGRDGQQPAGLPDAKGTVPKEGPKISLRKGELTFSTMSEIPAQGETNPSGLPCKSCRSPVSSLTN